MRQLQPVDTVDAKEGFEFTKTPRRFPVVDALPLRWPSSSSAASEYVEDWEDKAGKALGRYKLSKKTMACIASHTSRKNGSCTLSDRALSARSGRTIPSTKRDICRLKKLGFIIAEIHDDKGYRNRTRSLVLAVPDTIDEDRRIGRNDDQRIPLKEKSEWRSTYQAYVDPSDKGERRDV